jgi:hypothetical protein
MPHRRRPFALVLHLHQHQSSRNLHLQYLAKNQSTQRCQSLITQGSDHPPVLEPHMVLNAGLRARLGSILLQVPLPTSPHTRRCFVPFLGSLGRHAVRRHSGPPSWPSRRHAHTHAPVISHAPSHSRAPPQARTPTWEVKGGPLVLFLSLALDLATAMRPCTPRRMALPWRFASHTRLQGSGAPSLGCSVHASPPTLALNLMRLCPTAEALSAATLWCRPELRHDLRPSAILRPTPGPNPSCSHPRARAHPSARTHWHVRTRHGHPTALPCTAVASTPPCRPWRRPRRAGRLLPCSFPSSPSDPRGSREARHGACCPDTAGPHRRQGHPVSLSPLRHNVEHHGSQLGP